MKTLEANGYLDNNGILKLDNPLKIANQRVKVILLIPENEEIEIQDVDWLKAIMKHKIVLVPFPFDDLSGAKVRPAICLTHKITIYNHIVIAFITSQIEAATEHTDLLIDESDSAFSETGLKVSSAIRLHRMVTIPTNLVKRQLGDLPNEYQTELKFKLKVLFDF